MTADMMMKEMRALRKRPIMNSLPLMANLRPEKSGVPPMAPMSGVMIPEVRALTMSPKAAPMTTATARSMTLPRRRNFWKSLSMRLL